MEGVCDWHGCGWSDDLRCTWSAVWSSVHRSDVHTGPGQAVSAPGDTADICIYSPWALRAHWGGTLVKSWGSPTRFGPFFSINLVLYPVNEHHMTAVNNWTVCVQQTLTAHQSSFVPTYQELLSVHFQQIIIPMDDNLLSVIMGRPVLFVPAAHIRYTESAIKAHFIYQMKIWRRCVSSVFWVCWINAETNIILFKIIEQRCSKVWSVGSCANDHLGGVDHSLSSLLHTPRPRTKNFINK